MASRILHLKDRGVVRASGADVVHLLDGLVTNDLSALGGNPALHAGLLSPQGKILFEFFIIDAGGELLLETGADKAADLAKRLTFYKLRAAAAFEDVSRETMVLAALPGSSPAVPRGVIAFDDPRSRDLGRRLVLPRGRLPEIGAIDADDTAYAALRVAIGVPQAGIDYALGDTFPHEADFDLFNGVSFTKGCFVGQEVVARMQNKTVVRKRVVRISGTGLATGVDIRHGQGLVGTIGTVAGNEALAMLRLDRAAEAADKGEALTAAGTPISVDAAALTRYRDSLRNKPVIDL